MCCGYDWLIDYRLCEKKEKEETKIYKCTTTPPIPLKGKTKLGTMRPSFIASYYNDLFFVRDWMILIEMDQKKGTKIPIQRFYFLLADLEQVTQNKREVLAYLDNFKSSFKPQDPVFNLSSSKNPCITW